MKAKDIIIILLLLAVAVLCYAVGYRTGAQRTDQRKEAEFRLIMDKAMYEALSRGDLRKVHSSFSMFLLGDVRDYERRFGAPSGTNRLARDFAVAQVIAREIESQLVPISSIATNPAIVSKFGSNITITVEPER